MPKRLLMPLKEIKRRGLGFLFLLLLSLTAFSQTTITGKVTDDKGTPVQGATVAAQGSATTTGEDGRFSLSVPAGIKTLTITSIGFAEQQVSIDGKTDLTITLQTDARSLSDVVVVGYGTVRKRDVTGAVANISAKDFNQGVINNPLQQVQGKVAGLVITQPSGDPNGNLIIRLRGQTSLSGGQTPLIVLDGIPLDDPNQISSIPPGDIASYDVLKDVSATAIYGARGANGVIIINTKKGATGKSRVEYNGYIAVDKLAKDFNLLSADEWREAVKTVPGINQSTIDALDKGANTDWLDEMTRNAITHSHTVSVSGGTGKFNYRASINYMNQQGIIINSGKEQLGLRFNAQQKALDDKLDIQVSVLSNQNTRKYVDYSVFAFINTTPPTYPVYNADGTYYGYYDFEQQNPVAQQMLQTNQGKEYLTQVMGRADYELIKGLKVGTLGSISRFNLQSEFFQPTLPGVGNINNASKTNSNVNSKKGDVHINYIKDFGRHSINATGVYEYNEFTNDNFNANGRQYLVEQLGANSLGGGNPALNRISSYKEQFKLVSFLGRVLYNYDSRYFLTVSFRRDGSSKFGANNKWGNFPSASVGWRISQEKFFENVGWVNELKLNAGYGVVGNQDAINPYSTLLTLGNAGRYFNPSNATYPYPQSYAPNQNENPDLKWEERHGANIGISFALFNNRLNGNINAYSDKTKNLLFNYTVPVPPFFYNSILANVGTLTNKGVEIQLSGDIVRGQDFNWTAGGQITFNKTRITSLSGSYNNNPIATDQVPVGIAIGRGYAENYITYLKVGYAPYVFYLPGFAGLASAVDPTTNSNQLYYAEDGSKIAAVGLAKKNYIDPTPKFTYGISNNLQYKNWGLNFFLRGVAGQKIFNNYNNITSNFSRLPGNNVTKDALTNGIRGSQTATDYWLEKAGFLRLDNITLSYNIPSVKGVESMRVFVTGNNLFVITSYSGMDPEISTGNSAQSFIDANVSGTGFYPRSRTLSVGVNVAFK